MSATSGIEDKNSVAEARKAEKSNRDASPIPEGTMEPPIYEGSGKNEVTGGKTKITPSKQPLEVAHANIGCTDATNPDNVIQTQAQVDQIPGILENIDKSCGDYKITSENTNISDKDNMVTDSMINADDIVNTEETVASRNITEEFNPVEVINKTVVLNKVDDSTSHDVNNDIVSENVGEPLQTAHSNRKALMSEAGDNSDDNSEIECNDDEDMRLKWDDSNDDLIDSMECDISNDVDKQNVETSKDEPLMVVGMDTNDVLPVDNTIHDKDKNIVKNVGNYVSKSNTEAILNENKVTSSVIEHEEEISPTNDDLSASQDISVENSSNLIIKDHGINKPDVMLEIPTQELIDIDNDLSMTLDESALSPNVEHSTMVDEKFVDNDDELMEGDETAAVKDVISEILPDVTDNVGIPAESNKKCAETSSQFSYVSNSLGKSVSPDKFVVPKASENLDLSEQITPRTLNDETEVSGSVSTAASSTSKAVITSNKVSSASCSINPVSSNELLEVTNNLGTQVSPVKLTPDITVKVTETQVNSNPGSTTDELPAVPYNIGIKSSNEMIQGSTATVSDSISSTVTSSNDVTEIIDNLGTVVSSDNLVPDSPSKVPELPALLPPTINTPDTSGIIREMSDGIKEPATTPGTSPIMTEDIIDKLATTSHGLRQTENEGMSSNNMVPDTSDEMPEMSDSLGLLAESSRVMEDDDVQEDDEDADADDDHDFDQDESSNQMTTAEHSEDSNTQQSEMDVNRYEKEIDISPPVESEGEFQFMISNIESQGADRSEIEGNEEPVGDVLPEIQELAVKTEEAENIENLEMEQGETDDQADVKTVRLSDTSDNETDMQTTQQTSEDIAALPMVQTKQSPDKTRKLELSSSSQPVFNIVDLEESSSEEDIQEIIKEPETTPEPEVTNEDGMTSVNLPDDIEVMCTSAGSTSDIVTIEGEVVISGVPKPPPSKLARLNTSEVSIKTTSASSESTLVIPEAKTGETEKTSEEARSKPGPKLCLEIFNLDSDEEDPGPTAKDPPRSPARCMNPSCASGPHVPRVSPDRTARLHYAGSRKTRAKLCHPCAEALHHTKQNRIKGIKEFRPLLELGADQFAQDLVEISDSESEDEADEPKPPTDTIGEKGAKMLENNLAAIINKTWLKYKMDYRLKESHDMLSSELQKLEDEGKEIDDMLNECQVATDKLRNELYATFERGSVELPSFLIHDTPNCNYSGPEIEKSTSPPPLEPTRQSKRRLSLPTESTAKKPAIPLGYTPLSVDSPKPNVQESKTTIPAPENKMDDDKDVSVVKLSAESAPADLPPPGELCRAPLKVGMSVFAMRNAFGPWLRGKILECQPKLTTSSPFTMCRVKFDHKVKNPCKILSARCLAYPEPADVRMVIGTRIIALYKDPSNVKREQFFSGVVAEIPNPVNNYRYLVFFDDGYAQYVQHSLTRLVCESSSLVWEEVHPFSRQFVKDYLMAYPERPMVRLHEGQNLKTEWNGKWWSSRVVRVDASLAQVVFLEDGRREWVYRGSTRLAPLYLEFQAAGRHRQRPMPRTKAQTGINMPYVEYTRSDEQDRQPETTTTQSNEEMRRQRAVAKKSTAVPAPVAPAQPVQTNLDTVTSRVVYYTPKSAIKPHKMVPHQCGPKCRRSDVLSLKELRTYNPLAKPLLSGWERQIVRYKGHKEVMYRAPCGRRLRDMRELHRYLRATHSELPVDLFDFYHGTHCLAEFVLNKCLVGKKDLSHGKENVPVPCVNYYDESLPEFCSYNTERTPTAGVPLNLDPEFLCGCDCTDDCMDKTKCACWRMTLEGARTIGLEGPNVGYVYKRLPEPLPSGIYECNSRCKCKATCLNRVAQHPLQLKLQVFKTLNRGWGIRALNDIPKGAFLCVYAGNLLTDATANLDGLNEGDEYLAELDYIEVVEQMKEGYEEDTPAADRKLDKKELGKQRKGEESSSEDIPSSEEEGRGTKSDKEDDDFMPGYIGLGVTEFNKALRKRDRAKKDAEEKEKNKGKEKEKENAKEDEDCITISDDEEVREPSRFTAQAGMAGNEFISKYSSVRSHFGMDEACYIMDAKVQGNIGRYLNHSCTPNVFVQNVFVDTHDPRFPWVAFFALSHIKAGSELTWNYNYDVGSVPGKVLYCFCGAPNCRGRLL